MGQLVASTIGHVLSALHKVFNEFEFTNIDKLGNQNWDLKLLF